MLAAGVACLAGAPMPGRRANPTPASRSGMCSRSAAPPLHRAWQQSGGSYSPQCAGGGSTARYRSVRCRGFVGEGTRIAGEYHDADFPWEELVEIGQAAVARQLSERGQWQAAQQHQQAAGGDKESSDSSNTSTVPVVQEQAAAAMLTGSGSSSNGGRTEARRRKSRRISGDGTASAAWGGNQGGSGAEGESWERFHATHRQARFFKEKRYLMLEFPALGVEDPPQHIAEIGCGCGSALLPVLKANPACRVTGCDVSPTALQLFRGAAQQAGVEDHRIETFVLDASSPSCGTVAPASPPAGSVPASSGPSVASSFVPWEEACEPSSSSSSSSSGSAAAYSASPLAGLQADSCLLVFTLSALRPEDQPAVLAHAYAALRPGGLLLFRDYGLYDMAQLRFPGDQMLGPNLYRRCEGTLAYFFSTEAVRGLASDAGFEEVECQYACVQLRNRKKGGSPMRRVFVHGVFRKPL